MREEEDKDEWSESHELGKKIVEIFEELRTLNAKPKFEKKRREEKFLKSQMESLQSQWKWRQIYLAENNSNVGVDPIYQVI